MSGSEAPTEIPSSDERLGESAAHTPTEEVRPKENPAALQMRAQPVKALRFRRNILVGGVAIFSIGIAATMWWALAPRRPMAIGMSMTETEASRLPPDQLAGLPKSYDTVPQLGQPLPGDLGRPILKRQREGDDLAGVPPDDAGARAAAAAREKAAADLEAARQSSLLAITAQKAGEAASAELAATSQVTPAANVPEASAPDQALHPNGQARKQRFMMSSQAEGDINSHSLEPPMSPNIVSAGSVIAASLITGLRSDLPGLVTAQVSERVYDSPRGRTLLIPQGARLIGRYESAISYGQKRALVIWQRIIMPDGSAIRLDNAPATDTSGYAGLADKVDYHSLRLLQGVAISTLLGVGANLSISGESDLVRAVREAAQQNVSRAGDQITSRNLQVQPTIIIRPGTPVRLLVHHDLVLPPWKE
ncbi:TrbI/VirB10 family protein [Sphingobium sp. YBL2]|uniref:TrbI/VirB10 family protein n=1 Tax=Sphingobium sp. (strain YBL2) TaxID=484429 RepID=UPI0005CBCDFC|nr:TrbI/VirB10 family protein [Sphingobium sp. YBL2]AJR22736.1 conjugal transfer protein TrbI [Sphingobium sp. YBL2]